MSESELYGPILAEISRGPNRLFRQNAGVAWQGSVIERTPTRLVLAYPRALKMGVPGMSDLGGFAGVEITQDMVGKTLAVYAAIEVKEKGKPTPEQMAFIHMVVRAGGRAGVARSVEQAVAIIKGEPLSLSANK